MPPANGAESDRFPLRAVTIGGEDAALATSAPLKVSRSEASIAMMPEVVSDRALPGGVDRRSVRLSGRRRCAVRRFIDRFVVVAAQLAVVVVAAASIDGLKW